MEIKVNLSLSKSFEKISRFHLLETNSKITHNKAAWLEKEK